jgi:hypothetical protein
VNRVARAIPLLALAMMAVINVGRGCIHSFAPDGGAHSIAGLDITTDRQTILALFAQLGMQQIVLGLFEFFVLFFRRDLIVIALGLQTAGTLAGAFNFYLWRVLPVHVPGAPFNAGLSVVLVVAFLIALTTREKEAPAL